MCGIFAYTGKRDALPILIEGLNSLEYRGYDSAGVFIPRSGMRKSSGAVANLRTKLEGVSLPGTSGISHLRWATHGEPTERNAHPHADCSEEFWVVHNGIIENYLEIKNYLSLLGHVFVSDTDTEVIAHLLEEHGKNTQSFEEVLYAALGEIRGTYGLAISRKSEPDKIIAARMGAPIVVGVGEGEYFVASDASPILRHTRQVVYLEDGQVAVLTPSECSVVTIQGSIVDPQVHTIEWNEDQIQKSGYDHFMLKEIVEEPEVLRNTLRGRLTESGIDLPELADVAERLQAADRIIIVACGTAYYAGIAGEYMLERALGIPVELETASEFRYRTPVITPSTVLIAVSQSGETADTLEAIREAKRKGALTLAIVNVVGSTIAREVDARMYSHAGPEIGVASTKAYIAQVADFALLALFLRREESMVLEEAMQIADELDALPFKIEKMLGESGSIRSLAERYITARDFLYIGRKFNFGTAYEGALKLKEISYVHAEGCGAGEMKHGPLAMIDADFPTVAVVLQDSVYEKMSSNIQEIRARKGKVIALATEGDEHIGKLATDVIFIPKVHEFVSPLLAVIPLQLFAYHFATLLGRNVDRPRNLAKSVTVE